MHSAFFPLVARNRKVYLTRLLCNPLYFRGLSAVKIHDAPSFSGLIEIQTGLLKS